MATYIAKRLLAAIPVLFGLSIIVFLIMAMIPGDPATAILGSYATPENVAKLNADLGLDKPLPQQYLIWLGNLLQGDLGRSYALNRPVLDEVLERFAATLVLAGTALVLCSILGLLAGVVSAVRQYGLHLGRLVPVRFSDSDLVLDQRLAEGDTLLRPLDRLGEASAHTFEKNTPHSFGMCVLRGCIRDRERTLDGKFLTELIEIMRGELAAIVSAPLAHLAVWRLMLPFGNELFEALVRRRLTLI